MIIRSRAPVRISFGGGGTDLPPYCDRYGGIVLNATINKYIYVTLIPRKERDIKIISADYKRSFVFDNLDNIVFDGDLDLIKAVILKMEPDHGFELFLRSDIPPNTGLGSSGAVATALIGAFNHLRGDNKLNKYEIAELAYDIETKDLHNVGGRQDQYASVFGGFNYIEFYSGSFVRVSPVTIEKDYIYELEKHLVLAFLGARGPSGEIQSIMTDQQIDESGSGENEKTKILNGLKEDCRHMYQTLASGELDKFGRLLDNSWNKKRSLSSMVSTKHIDEIYQKAKEAGALGGKITGAGGGGCMIFFCKSNKEHEVTKCLEEMGVKVIDFTFDNDGLVVWEIKLEDRNS
ncbi:MAG: GHMP kinase [Nitrospirae bacterium]|nr:GHMP kinase [Nitrospirota bacterium]